LARWLAVKNNSGIVIHQVKGIRLTLRYLIRASL